MISHFLRPSLIKLYKASGFDFIYVENEHILHNPEAFGDCLITAHDNDIPVITKPAYWDRGECARLLDAGVSGVQLPQTETREQIAEFASWAKYPPLGTRMISCPLATKDFRDFNAADLARSNDETLVIAHVETKKGVDNIADIVKVPLVDVVFIGTADLAISLGAPFDYNSKQFISAVDRIISVALNAGKIPGMFIPSQDFGQRWIEAGVRFIETVGELSFIASGAKTLVSDFQSMVRGT